MPVYFARLGSGHVKIGHATDVLRRIQAFQTAHTEKLTVIRLVEGGRETEARLHELFRHLCVEREWFRFSEELVAPLPDLTELPIPLPKRRGRTEPDTAAMRKWRMMEFIFSQLGGDSGAAKKLGLPVWHPSLRSEPEHHLSGLALLMQAAGHQNITYQVLADLFYEARIEKETDAVAHRRRKRVESEVSFVERKGIDAVWWQLAPETRAEIARKAAILAEAAAPERRDVAA